MRKNVKLIALTCRNEIFLIVTGQCLFNVADVTLVPNFGRILVASCYLTLV